METLQTRPETTASPGLAAALVAACSSLLFLALLLGLGRGPTTSAFEAILTGPVVGLTYYFAASLRP